MLHLLSIAIKYFLLLKDLPVAVLLHYGGVPDVTEADYFFWIKAKLDILLTLPSRKFQDLVVGYMGVPKYSGISMMQHPQYVTVR